MSQPTAASAEGPRQDVSDICDRVAAELQRLAELALKLENTLAGAAHSWAADSDLQKDLQQLDALSQHLMALRDFMASLPPAASGSIDIESSLKLIPLEKMRARLAGSATDEHGLDVELFR